MKTAGDVHFVIDRNAPPTVCADCARATARVARLVDDEGRNLRTMIVCPMCSDTSGTGRYGA